MLDQVVIPIRPEFVNVVFEELPPVAVALLDEFRGDVWVAGGAVRDALAGTGPAHDIDFWFRYLTTYENAQRFVRDAIPGVSSKLTSFALTFNPPTAADIPPLQFIREFYSDPAETIRQFDFSVNQGAVWVAPGGAPTGAMTAEFADDIQHKRLRYVRPPQPMPRREVYRMTQLLSRGYVIDEPEIDCVLGPLIEHITEIPREVVAVKLHRSRRNSGYRGRHESEETTDLQAA
jgi:hypothetical protein